MGSIINYYRRSLVDLFTQIHELRGDPYASPQKCLSIQQVLVQKITYVEKRVRELNKCIKEAERQLHTKQTPLLRKDEARQIKATIEHHRQAVREYKDILRVLRSVGDAIAFIYLPKWDIKPMTLKETSGFISGKEGLRLELQVLRLAFEKGAIAILNDITTCLRYGDITVFAEEKLPLILELKSGSYQSPRADRQLSELEDIMDYLQTDETVRDEYLVRRLPLISEERNCVAEINQLVEQATKIGFAFSQVERGLYYCVQTGHDIARLKAVLTDLNLPLIAYYLNLLKYDNLGYYPFALSILDPEAVFAFFRDQL